MSKRVVIPCWWDKRHRWNWEAVDPGTFHVYWEKRCQRCRREYTDVLG